MKRLLSKLRKAATLTISSQPIPGLGLAQEGLGDFASAAKSFRKALESVEEIRSTLKCAGNDRSSLTFELAGSCEQRRMRELPESL